ncbi:MAG: lamin tail domain-containing protein [bacterium]|nr:lamin tail domain-containing protein [bacterium]
MKTLFFALFLVGSFWTTPGFGQVVLSEVMFDPSGSEFYDEFIEVQNLGSDPVDLAGWWVGDADEVDEMVPRRGSGLLAPGAFGLILDSGYFEHSTQYDPLPEGVVVFTVPDATLGEGGLSEARAERVLLISAAGDTVGDVRYRIGNRPGFSEEKVDPAGGDGPENWVDARWEGGTPGRVNSVSPKVYDLALRAISESPLRVPAVASGPFVLEVVNLGREEAGRFEVCVGAVWKEERAGLAPGDSLRVVYPVAETRPGWRTFVADVVFAEDQDSTNNRVEWEGVVGVLPGQVVVSEIMFSPVEGGPEWVEVLNRSGHTLDLWGWQVVDAVGGMAVLEQAELAAGEYRVIAADAGGFEAQYRGVVPVVSVAGWPVLNDGGDVVVLRDATGTVVDSVSYEGSAPVLGRSLERIDPGGSGTDPANWLFSTAEFGATPGAVNSVALQGESVGVELVASPNPFQDRTEILYRLPVRRANVNLWVFDREGRRVRTLLSGEAGGSSRRVVWDGAGEDGQRLKPGIYVFYLEAAVSGGRVLRSRTAVVLAAGL